MLKKQQINYFRDIQSLMKAVSLLSFIEIANFRRKDQVEDQITDKKE